MSFQNAGVTPHGRKFYRGEAILAERLSHCVTGHIAEIGESDGEIFVTANLMTGVFNTMGGDPDGKQFPPIEYEGTGYRHQSTGLGRGETASSKGMLLFCFADETPTFAMGDAPGTVAEREHTQPVDEPAGGTNAPGTPAEVEEEFDPRDTNRDHRVSRQEKRDFKDKE